MDKAKTRSVWPRPRAAPVMGARETQRVRFFVKLKYFKNFFKLTKGLANFKFTFHIFYILFFSLELSVCVLLRFLYYWIEKREKVSGEGIELRSRVPALLVTTASLSPSRHHAFPTTHLGHVTLPCTLIGSRGYSEHLRNTRYKHYFFMESF